MVRYPQAQENVKVRSKVNLSSEPSVAEIIKQVEAILGTKGRVFVRVSGTEPLVRVLVEGEDAAKIRTHTHEIAETIRKKFG